MPERGRSRVGSVCMLLPASPLAPRLWAGDEYAIAPPLRGGELSLISAGRNTRENMRKPEIDGLSVEPVASVSQAAPEGGPPGKGRCDDDLWCCPSCHLLAHRRAAWRPAWHRAEREEQCGRRR